MKHLNSILIAFTLLLFSVHVWSQGATLAEVEGNAEVEVPIEGYNSEQVHEQQQEQQHEEDFVSSLELESSPFVDIFGESLYKWDDVINESGERQILEVSTSDVLKDKKVIGIYFSASWCGPCRTFTPQLAQFYQEMNKKGKKFEIVWVSRDRTADDYVMYYSKMPWLAVPISNVEQVFNNIAGKYNCKGFPHMVILDGYDASVYTLDGRTMVAKDKYGLEFPWAPRTLMNALPRPLKDLIKRQVMDNALVTY